MSRKDSPAAREPEPRGFPDTRASLVQGLASADEFTRREVFDLVVRAYRTPVIAFVSRKWRLPPEDAEDLAQEFFTRVLEKEWLARFDSTRGRFRTFLLTCLLTFAAGEHDRARAQKRGGGVRHETLETWTTLPEAGSELEELFEREWLRSVLQLALAALRSEAEAKGKLVAFELFERYDVLDSTEETPASYATLAAEYELPATQVTNWLAWARRSFRRHVLDTIRTLSASDEEYRDEVRTLLGPWVT